MQASSEVIDARSAEIAAADRAEEAQILDEANASRSSEELTALLVGFATGITIAGVFLVYILIAYADWFP